MNLFRRFTVPILLAGSLILAPLVVASGPGDSYIEIGGSYHNLDAGYPDWKGGYLSGVIQANSATTFNFGLHSDRRFDDSGQFVSAGVTRQFNQDWFGSLAIGGGSGSFHPESRVDGSVSVRLGPNRNLVATLGAGHIEEADNIHSANLVSLGLTYYAEGAPVIVEAGVTGYKSDPGDVSSRRVFGAVTYGRDKQRYLTVRAETGNEAYQLAGSTATLTDFDSSVYNVIWREWWTRKMGTNVNYEYYKSDHYERNGVSVGVFFNF